MAVTIKDIARLSEVSITTVSLILNKKDKEISEETRQRVLRVIKEQNYVPSSIARSMITKKTKIIGLLVPDVTNPYFPELVRGIEDVASSFGYNVLLCNTDDNQEKEMEYTNILKDKQVDGIIFISAVRSNHNGIIELSNSGMPVVVLDRILEQESLNSVYLDNVEGGYIATVHFIEKGHKKIGCITGPLENKSAKDRYEGYRKAIQEGQLNFEEGFVYEGDYKFSAGEEGAELLIKAGVSAIFVSNDMMAYGVYRKLGQLGLKIPEDISVVGYDDIYLSTVHTPALSTVRQPRHEMGEAAVSMLIKAIEGKEIEENKIRFTPVLMERDSVKRV